MGWSAQEKGLGARGGSQGAEVGFVEIAGYNTCEASGIVPGTWSREIPP